jgi:hypothetical protein
MVAIRHTPCLNHGINLVFISALKFPCVAEALFILPGIIHTLNSRDAFEIIRRHCPTIVPARWVYVTDVLGFISKHLNSVQTGLPFPDELLISVTCIHLYILFLPFVLFSRAMETRSRLLAEVIPATREILRELSEAWNFFEDFRCHWMPGYIDSTLPRATANERLLSDTHGIQSKPTWANRHSAERSRISNPGTN